MKSEDSSALIALYAALLSTYLGIREILKSLPRFDVSLYSTGDPEQGDIITIYNESHKNVVINSYSVIKNGKSIWLGNESDFYLISIKPQEAYTIIIDQEYKFKWDGEIYIQLHIMGRSKPIKKRIT